MDVRPDVSVVVATYNRRDGLEALLRGLARQTYKASRFEVVVVDDGSTDGTPGLLRTISVPYALRSLTQANSGPAVARNLGVEHARGSIIQFLDDDVVPAPNLIEAHVAVHGERTDLVVTGPMLAPPLDWPQPAWDRWDAAQLEKQYQAMRDGKFPCTQRQFFTANASLHRSMFEAVGGFDAEFKRAEDMDLAWRMSRQGARFAFEPNAEVVHYAARSFVSWCRKAYQYGAYDVVMEREKAIPVFELACQEYHTRRAVNRWLTEACVGRTLLRDSVLFGLSMAVHVGARYRADRLVSFALSSIFNIRYWQGASDELGGPARLWHAIANPGATGLSAAARTAEAARLAKSASGQLQAIAPIVAATPSPVASATVSASGGQS
ncbi:MAG: glycosyltransferase family 2 protein [Chloroflexota bacterium]